MNNREAIVICGRNLHESNYYLNLAHILATRYDIIWGPSPWTTKYDNSQKERFINARIVVTQGIEDASKSSLAKLCRVRCDEIIDIDKLGKDKAKQQILELASIALPELSPTIAIPIEPAAIAS